MPSTETRFLALGGVWVDDISKCGNVVISDVVGGSVTFATFGARLFTADSPSSIRMIVNAGHDFPPRIVGTLRQWKTKLSINWLEDLPSARGIVHYGEDESERYYERLTSPLSTSWSSLTTSDILNTQSFHFFETPDALVHDVNRIIEQGSKSPFVLWEPQAKSMRAATLQRHLDATKYCNVFSPNHIELCQFFEESTTDFNRSRIEQYALCFVRDGLRADSQGCVVVRCAEHGCLVVSLEPHLTWLPAYSDISSIHVVNSTGAGNAFLGGFAIGYQETKSFVEAAKYGSVAASFVIEQAGLPVLSTDDLGDLWNGDSARKRLDIYRAGLSSDLEI